MKHLMIASTLIFVSLINYAHANTTNTNKANLIKPANTQTLNRSQPTIVEMGHINQPCHCFPEDIKNLNLSKVDNLKLSKETGQSIQFIAYQKDPIKALQIDEVALNQAVNDYGKIVGSYFKKHPELKGTFITYVNYFPGYPKPFQMSPRPNFDSNKFNQIMNQESHCNEAHACGALLFSSTRFIDEADSFNFDDKYKQNFIKEVSPLLKEIKPVYFKNTNNEINQFNHSISFFIVMGTNGQEVPKDKVYSLFGIK